ncbi:hypothetical protein [Streptomyces sp. NPDC057557]|uniref:hypothetical protein n=1 Tax=Streptomyces sp. NPDC057557 TaxID=3346167 RepID=UPI0036A6A383
MRTRTTAAVITAGLFFATLTACGGSDEKPKDQPKASAAAELTAKTAADKLADATGVTTLGHPTDNTSACATGKSKNDCTQLITTDTVSIYQFPSAEVAAHWVATMKKQGDWRQADSFALAWTARDQKLTSDERKTELLTALKKLTTK